MKYLKRTRLSRCRMIWLLSHPTPPNPVNKLYLFFCMPVCVSPVDLTYGRGGKGGWWAKSYDNEKAWSSINHSNHSDYTTFKIFLPIGIMQVIRCPVQFYGLKIWEWNLKIDRQARVQSPSGNKKKIPWGPYQITKLPNLVVRAYTYLVPTYLHSNLR